MGGCCLNARNAFLGAREKAVKKVKVMSEKQFEVEILSFAVLFPL